MSAPDCIRTSGRTNVASCRGSRVNSNDDAALEAEREGGGTVGQLDLGLGVGRHRVGVEGEEREGLLSALPTKHLQRIERRGRKLQFHEGTYVRDGGHGHSADRTAGVEVTETAHASPLCGGTLILIAGLARSWWVGNVGDERVHGCRRLEGGWV